MVENYIQFIVGWKIKRVYTFQQLEFLFSQQSYKRIKDTRKQSRTGNGMPFGKSRHLGSLA